MPIWTVSASLEVVGGDCEPEFNNVVPELLHPKLKNTHNTATVTRTFEMKCDDLPIRKKYGSRSISISI